jgi:murein tripeptide amidase MpaA
MLRRILGISLLAAGCASAATPDLLTTAERTEFRTTGRYAEVGQLCAAYQRAWPRAVRCFSFGSTPEGRPLWALAVSTDGVTRADQARRRGRPVVLLQGGIHSGEIDGKDAGFIALRGLLSSAAGRAQLAKVTAIFVPVFNADGHERFKAWNRPNQRGPEEMGWRTTAQNLNLNRDYVKADAPEMRALLALLTDWDPIVYADLHVTDGADFEHDISITGSIALAGDAGLQQERRGLIARILAALERNGSLPLDFYPSLNVEDQPASGFSVSVAPPRFSESYWALRNRFGILVETHSWKPYPARVAATRVTIETLIAEVAEHGTAWRALSRSADERAAALGGTVVGLAYRNTAHTRLIDFRGYAYAHAPSAISGAVEVHYDPGKPQIWRVPLFDEVEPSAVVLAPRGGYVVPAAYAAPVRERLLAHRLQYATLTCSMRNIEAEVFRAQTVVRDAASFEGRARTTVTGQWTRESIDAAPGSLYVPLGQPAARLVMAMLEPQAPDSFVSWGFFDVAFERREYMENYVAEQVGTEMLARDQALQREFAGKLAADPAFAASPQARRDFFYQRHASWDARYRLVPTYRTAASPCS